MDIQAKLASMNLSLPDAPKPVAAYVPSVRVGDLVVLSGQLPFASGKLLCTGRVPSQVSVEQAVQAARQCALNALAVLGAEVGGDWGRVVRIVRLGVFVACDNDFSEQPKVANGASELMVALFGDAGRHARAAVGTNALPLGAPVELELTAQVR